MNILGNEKAPYLLVVLLSVIGWLVTQVVEEVRSTRAAISYSIEVNENNREIIARIENTSRTTRVSAARYSLACAASRPCFVPLNPPRPNEDLVYGAMQPIPPFLVSGQMGESSSWAFEFETSLPPGAAFTLRGRLSDPGQRADFYFQQNDQNTEGVYVYDRRTFIGTLAANFTAILVSFLLLSVAGLIAYLASLVRMARRRRRPRPSKVDQSNSE